MTSAEIPYWFWQGFGLIVLAIFGQILYKWLDFKFFTKEDKWTGTERRHTMEIDEGLLKQFIDIYQKHVDFVGVLSENSKVNTAVLEKFVVSFSEHDERESKNQIRIKQIHEEIIK